MRTFETTVYTYQELSPEAQQKAIDNNRDWNVDHDWWDCTYEDAERIGAKIGGFDLDRRYWTIDFTLDSSVGEIVQFILKEHGRQCDTFELAQEYFRRKKIGKPMDTDEFSQQLGECYLNMLESEYDYLTSDESVADSLEMNDMEFTEEGVLA